MLYRTNDFKNSMIRYISKDILGVRTQIVISNSSLRERRGYTKFYYITDLLSVDMAIYDSIVNFQKINPYYPLGLKNFLK